MTTKITNANITNTGVTAGSYTNANITVNAQGQLTSASSGSSGVSWQAVQTTGFTAVSGRGYPCNTTSAAFTVTLPASPSAGDLITLVDYAGTWDTNNLTIDPNGGKLNGSTLNGIVSTERGAVNLVYVDSTQGWISYASNLSASIATTIPVEYLIVAGGGGGTGGGGGAGGVVNGSLNIAAGVSTSVTVGAGGNGTSATNPTPGTDTSNGFPSQFSTVTSALGGGYGGKDDTTGQGANSGGSGGGAGNASGVAGTGANGTSGQGNKGGDAAFQATFRASAGGGGAGAQGGNTTGGVDTAGNGGNGVSTYSTWLSAVTAAGLSVGQNIGGTYWIGGGGGGGCFTGTAGSGGNGGGGAGLAGSSGSAGSGTARTGGGGGGKTPGQAGTSGNGGGGVVIIRYSDSLPAATSTTGSPTTTTSGGYRYYAWSGNGSITF